MGWCAVRHYSHGRLHHDLLREPGRRPACRRKARARARGGTHTPGGRRYVLDMGWTANGALANNYPQKTGPNTVDARPLTGQKVGLHSFSPINLLLINFSQISAIEFVRICGDVFKLNPIHGRYPCLPPIALANSWSQSLSAEAPLYLAQ